jgi:hypothetical protein
MRGWIYLFYGSATYISYALAWGLLSELGYANWTTFYMFAYSFALLLAPVMVIITVFYFVVFPNLSVIWFLLSEGKARKASSKFNTFVRSNSSFDYTQRAAIFLGALFWMTLFFLNQFPYIIPLLPFPVPTPLGTQIALLTSVLGLALGLILIVGQLEYYARRQRNIELWKRNGKWVTVGENDIARINEEFDGFIS